MAVVDEVDVKGRVLDLQDTDNDSCALGNYGDDGRPAPLQIMQLPGILGKLCGLGSQSWA
eukprot:4825114-Ditylum_brightwellii.AAC.1